MRSFGVSVFCYPVNITQKKVFANSWAYICVLPVNCANNKNNKGLFPARKYVMPLCLSDSFLSAFISSPCKILFIFPGGLWWPCVRSSVLSCPLPAMAGAVKISMAKGGGESPAPPRGAYPCRQRRFTHRVIFCRRLMAISGVTAAVSCPFNVSGVYLYPFRLSRSLWPSCRVFFSDSGRADRRRAGFRGSMPPVCDPAGLHAGSTQNIYLSFFWGSKKGRFPPCLL